MFELFNHLGASDFVAFVLTYLLHSTVWVLLVVGLVKLSFLQTPLLKNYLWKAALIGGLVTSSFVFYSGNDLLEIPVIGKTTFQKININKDGSAGLIYTDRPVTENLNSTVVENKKTEKVGFAVNNILPLIFKTVLIVWGIISLFLLLKIFIQHVLFFRKINDRKPIHHPTILKIFNSLLKKADLNEKIKLSQSPGLDSPILIHNHEICLPEKALVNLEKDQLEGMLAHELEHVYRKDYLWNYVIAFMEALFFFQPLQRLIKKEINTTNELLCDEWAANLTGDHLALANCLVTVAGWIKQRPDSFALVAGMSLRKSELSNRISSLINLPDMKEQRFNFLRAGLSIVLSMAIIGLVLPGFTFTNLLSPYSSGGNDCAALLRAVKKNDVTKVRELAAKTDVNCNYREEGEPRSPLNAAARKGNVEIGKILLEAGADVEHRSQGDEGALMGAARHGHMDFVKLMVENGARINKRVIGDGTALINAVRGGHYEIAEYLLENGADPMKSSPGDENPIYHATQHGDKMLDLVLRYRKGSK